MKKMKTYEATCRFIKNEIIAEMNARYYKQAKEFHEKTTCIFCNDPKQEKSFMCQNHKDEKIPWKLDISHISMRISINAKIAKNIDDPRTKDKWEWLLETPFNTRDLAIKQIVEAYLTEYCKS